MGGRSTQKMRKRILYYWSHVSNTEYFCCVFSEIKLIPMKFLCKFCEISTFQTNIKRDVLLCMYCILTIIYFQTKRHTSMYVLMFKLSCLSCTFFILVQKLAFWLLDSVCWLFAINFCNKLQFLSTPQARKASPNIFF